MKVKIKRLSGKRWVPLEAELLLNSSVVQYLSKSQDKLVAVATDADDNKIMVISNDQEWVDYYTTLSDKDEKRSFVVVHVNEFRQLFGENVVPKVIVSVFPDGEIDEIKPVETQGTLL